MRRRRRRRLITPRKIKTALTLLAVLGLVFLVRIWNGGIFDDEDIYSGYPMPPSNYKELIITPNTTLFSIWAPEADEVKLLIYDDGEVGHANEMIPMEQNSSTGVWSVDLKRSMVGSFYAFNLKYDDIWRGDTPGLMAHAVGVNGKRAAIINWDETNPENWSKDKTMKLTQPTDAIIYSLHIREFTRSATSGVSDSIHGTYLGLSHDGATYEELPTALGHLKELGVTHVKLMPVADFQAIDEKFAHSADMYDWGFETLNYAVPDGSYSTNAKDPYARIRELKTMVFKLHEAGIGVMLDVDFVISLNAFQTNFERIVPGYFFYVDADKRKGYREFGIDKYLLATERPFVRRLIQETLQYWMTEYHIDGFCLDKVDLYNPITLEKLANHIKKINSNALILGNYSSLATYKSVSKLDSIANLSGESIYFMNYLRPDSLSKKTFLLRHDESVEFMKMAVIGGVRHSGLDQTYLDKEEVIFNDSPVQAVNRLSSYTGLILNDYLKKYAVNNVEAVRLSKLAYTTLLTSQGIVDIYGGDEFLRSKNGLSNTLREGDAVNQINWSLKSLNSTYYEYISGLVKLRKEHPAFRMSSKEQLEEHFEFIPTSNPLAIAYRLKENANGDEWEDIIVVLNSSRNPARVTIPEGRYIAVCRDGQFQLLGLNYVYGQLLVNPQSAAIIYRTSKEIVLPSKPEEPVVKKPVIIPKNEDLLPEIMRLPPMPVMQKNQKKKEKKKLNDFKINN